MSAIKTLSMCHMRAGLFSLGRLLRTPVTTFLTVAVIGIVLALPTSLYVLLSNVQGVSQGWNQDSTQIAVYLNPRLTDSQVQDMLRQLRTNPQVSDVQYISPQEGLTEFAKVVGSKAVIKSLQTNPLPGVIMVQPILSLRSPLAINQLVSSLQQLPEVDRAKLNMQWLQRIHSIFNLIRHGITALAFLLGIGVLLIIGNTIRLATQNERKEIAVLKLVGATNAFIRRPFLYIGFWYGLFGGILAWLLVNGVLWWVRAPAAKVASAYSSDFYLHGLTSGTGINLLIISILLGLVGAWAATSRSLRLYC